MDRSGRAPGSQERWHQAKRLLHDDTIDTADRVAGLFLLLYAQRLATISRLTVEDIETNGAAIELHFGSVPITIPEPLSAVITDLVTTRRSHAVLAAGTASPRLFPGGPRPADQRGQRSAPAYERSDCDPPKPAPQPCSSSPPNCPRPSGPPTRHPHQRRRPMAATLRRRLDQLRSRPRPETKIAGFQPRNAWIVPTGVHSEGHRVAAGPGTQMERSVR